MRIKDFEIEDLNEPEEGVELQEVPTKKEDAPKKNLLKEILGYVITLVVTLALVSALKTYVLINANVPTGSMENTIMAGDSLFGNRLAYTNEEPKRGDVIFFYYPDDESQKFVKRIIGLPGETVRIEDGKIYINDNEKPLEETYLKEEWVHGTGPFEYKVPEGSYFVLGDNRNTSKDSRYWVNTFVKKEKIIGKAVLIYYPFNHFGIIE